MNNRWQAVALVAFFVSHTSTASWECGYIEPAGHLDSAYVTSLRSLELGMGPELYAVGELNVYDDDGGSTYGIARWDGDNWTTLNPGKSTYLNGQFRDAIAYDDGNGVDLYVCGRFSGHEFSSRGESPEVLDVLLIRWTGNGWEPVAYADKDSSQHAFCLEIYDGGDGPRLVMGGRFTTVDGIPANNVASWNGAVWSPLGQGVEHDAYPGIVFDLHVWDGVDGSRLYAAGDFEVAGRPFQGATGFDASAVAAWDGTKWTSLDSSSSTDDIMGRVFALETHVDDGEERLYLGGSFSVGGPFGPSGLVSWGADGWRQVANVNGGLSGIRAMESALHEGERVLFIGGDFSLIDGASITTFARWNGTEWEGARPDLFNLANTVISLEQHGDAADGSLFLGGLLGLDTESGIEANVAKTTTDDWLSIEFPETDPVRLLESIEIDERGPLLVAVGNFSLDEGLPGLATWDGVSWEGWPDVPQGALNELEDANQINDLGFFDLGDGLKLYAAGNQLGIYDPSEDSLVRAGAVRWSSGHWELVGSVDASVSRIEAVNHDVGSSLYGFVRADCVGGIGVPQNVIDLMILSGDTWVSISEDLQGSIFCQNSGSFHPVLNDIAPIRLGGVEYLAVTGKFINTVNGARNFGLWDGAQWLSPKEIGNVFQPQDDLRRLAVASLGAGEQALFVSGVFSMNGEEVNLARLDSSGWTALGEHDIGNHLEVHDFGHGPELVTHSGRIGLDGEARALNVGRIDGEILHVHSAAAGPIEGLYFAGNTYDDFSGQEMPIAQYMDGCVVLSIETSPADLTGDGAVDTFDLAALLAFWGSCGGCPEDLNGDSVIDAFDLAILLAAWD